MDVGANIGSYAIWAGEIGAEVIALEPAKDTFILLMENVALNGYPARGIRAAAGATCGTARFTTGGDSVNRSLSGTRAPSQPLAWIGSMLGTCSQNTGTASIALIQSADLIWSPTWRLGKG